jgi:hypothetical protein
VTRTRCTERGWRRAPVAAGAAPVAATTGARIARDQQLDPHPRRAGWSAARTTSRSRPRAWRPRAARPQYSRSRAGISGGVVVPPNRSCRACAQPAHERARLRPSGCRSSRSRRPTLAAPLYRVPRSKSRARCSARASSGPRRPTPTGPRPRGDRTGATPKTLARDATARRFPQCLPPTQRPLAEGRPRRARCTVFTAGPTRWPDSRAAPEMQTAQDFDVKTICCRRHRRAKPPVFGACRPRCPRWTRCWAASSTGPHLRQAAEVRLARSYEPGRRSTTTRGLPPAHHGPQQDVDYRSYTTTLMVGTAAAAPPIEDVGTFGQAGRTTTSSPPEHR